MYPLWGIMKNYFPVSLTAYGTNFMPGMITLLWYLPSHFLKSFHLVSLPSSSDNRKVGHFPETVDCEGWVTHTNYEMKPLLCQGADVQTPLKFACHPIANCKVQYTLYSLHESTIHSCLLSEEKLSRDFRHAQLMERKWKHRN